MKFIRLPRLPVRSPGAAPLFTRARLRFFLYGLALLLVSFIVGLYLFFPTYVLQERLEREIARGPVSLEIADLDLTFPPGLQAETVTLVDPYPGRETVEFSQVAIYPLWGSLLGPDPGVRFQGRLQGGDISGWTRQDGRLEARAQGITFAERLMEGSALEIAGILREGSFSGRLPPAAGTDNDLQLSLDQVRLTGMEGLGVEDGTLVLGQVTLRGEGKGNNFRVESLEASGGEVQLSGSGSLLLAQPLERSRINLNLTLRPGAGFDPALRDLLELFAGASRDGSYRLRLAGTLGSPIFAK